MGGNAFKEKGIESKRLSKDEYDIFSGSFIRKLRKLYPGFSFVVPLSYSSKESFGDLDIITTHQGDFSEIPNIQHRKVNGPCVSILIDNFQIDLVRVPEDEYTTSWYYYSYNDLGNLLGKIFHKFGLKYGHRGLTLPVREGDHYLEEIILSKDQDQIMRFIGLEAWWEDEKDFETLEEIYRYVESSPFFNPKIYQYSVLNSVNKIRDRTRSTYQGFISRWKGKLEGDWYEFKEDKEYYLPVIFHYFPGTEKKYLEIIKKLSDRKFFKAQLNGAIISEWTELEGKELGEFIRSFYYTLSNGWSKDLNEEQIKETIMKLFGEFKCK